MAPVVVWMRPTMQPSPICPIQQHQQIFIPSVPCHSQGATAAQNDQFTIPWLSQCLVSANYWDLLASLAKNDKAVQCWRPIFRSTPPPELNDAYFSEFYCVESVISCVNEVLVSAIQVALDSTTTNCCEPMKQQILETLPPHHIRLRTRLSKSLGDESQI